MHIQNRIENVYKDDDEEERKKQSIYNDLLL